MNLLVTGAWRQAEQNIEKLRRLGFQVAYLKQEKDELPCEPDWVEAVICNNLFAYHPLEQFKNLKYIQLTSAGMDRMPLDYINDKHIKLYNAKGVYRIPMAEFVLAGVLNVYKCLPEFHDNQKKHIWNKNRELVELTGKRVCIIGCGDVGLECAKRFKAFGCKVIGLNRTVREYPYFDEVKPLSDLNIELAEADITVVSIALTSDTYHLLNRSNLDNLKEGSLIVNVSRGKVINTDDLLYVIKKRRVKAVLDVFEDEPLKIENVLWNAEGVCIISHNDYISDQTDIRLTGLNMENLVNEHKHT